MRTLRRVIAGKLAKSRGQNFENILHGEAARSGWSVIKIPQGCRRIGGGQLQMIRSPMDFIFLKKGKALFVDAKTTKAKSYSFSSLTPHQVKMLRDIELEGFVSGYVVNFSELNLTVFFSGRQISSLRDRSSLKPSEGIHVGTDRILNLDRVFSSIDEIDMVPAQVI